MATLLAAGADVHAKDVSGRGGDVGADSLENRAGAVGGGAQADWWCGMWRGIGGSGGFYVGRAECESLREAKPPLPIVKSEAQPFSTFITFIYIPTPHRLISYK